MRVLYKTADGLTFSAQDGTLLTFETDTWLITDRTQQDVVYVKQLIAKIVAGTATEPELAEWKSLTLKGAYNYTDLNRVSAAMEYLRSRLNGYGYATPGYQRIEVPHRTVAVSKLPEGFTELEYIQSSGTQYIDTGFKPNQDTRLYAETYCPLDSKTFCGVYDSNGKRYGIYAGANYRNDYNETRLNGSTTNITQKFVIDKNKNIQTVNGVSSTASYAQFSLTETLHIFSYNDRGEATYLGSGIKLYSFQIYDNGTLVRDYVPVKDANGNVGLYDLVESKFYGNAGTGAFIAGPIPVELPDGYTQVEYIQSHGTEYIDTGFIPNQDTRVVCKATCPVTDSSNWLFGARASSTSMTYCFVASSRGYYFPGYNAGQISFSTAVNSNDPLLIDFNKQTVSITGNGTTETKTGTYGTFTAPTSMLLFANSTNGTVGYGKVRIYSCQIYDNGTLVRDYVPCINPDGAYGLYDVANSKFYSNAGSGAFTGGAVVDPPVPSDPSDDETRDPFFWYEDDIPTATQMAQYILNVAVIRDTLEVMSTTPATPSDMEGLTAEEANAIEFILIDVQTLINNMVAAWFYSGDLYAGEV